MRFLVVLKSGLYQLSQSTTDVYTNDQYSNNAVPPDEQFSRVAGWRKSMQRLIVLLSFLKHQVCATRACDTAEYPGLGNYKRIPTWTLY